MEAVDLDPSKTKLTVSANDALIKFEYSHQGQQIAYFDKSTGKIVDAAVQAGQFNTQHQVYHIIGILNILKASFLVVVTDRVAVDGLLGHLVFRVSGVELLPLKLGLTLSEAEEQYLSLVRTLLCDDSFYFSYTYDLTSSRQRSAAATDVDERFHWNIIPQENFISLCQPERNPAQKGLLKWSTPIIRGYFEKRTFPGKCGQQEIVLICRRSWKREGRRYTMRGASKDGSVANYCEIEQILISESHLSSFVQIRGSVPLKWSQHANLAWDPPIVLKDSFDLQLQTCENHLRTELRFYKTISIVSLIKKTGSESKLGSVWDKTLSTLNEPKVFYHTFDLHKEVGHSRFEALQKLWEQTDAEVSNFGFFSQELQGSRRVLREQGGVMRTNCKDNLDRTNLVQHNFAQQVGFEQLVSNLTCEEPAKVAEADKVEVQRYIRIMWADCGDATSVQYAGTPAMRSDFAKTGKHSYMGMVNDGINSMKRYYLNNFEDGEAQDAVDVFLQKLPLSQTYAIDASLQKPSAYNIIQRFFGNFFLVIYSFLKPAHVQGVRLLWGFFWMFSVFLTWTIFRLDPNLIVERPVIRTNLKASSHLQRKERK